MKLISNKFDTKASGIYVITNMITGKIYVGSTKCFKDRHASHLWYMNRKDKPTNSKLYLSARKHGSENFKFEIVEPVPEDLLKSVEQAYIDWFKASQNGYNTSGLASRVEMTPEIRARISATKQERGFANQIAGAKAYAAANPEKVKAHMNRIRAMYCEQYSAIDEPTLKTIIKEYIADKNPSVIKLGEKYGVCYSTLAKIFKRTSSQSKYTEFLIKIGFEGSSIKDLRKPEIQAKLILN